MIKVGREVDKWGSMSFRKIWLKLFSENFEEVRKRSRSMSAWSKNNCLIEILGQGRERSKLKFW